jgi:hypothetical protein
LASYLRVLNSLIDQAATERSYCDFLNRLWDCATVPENCRQYSLGVVTVEVVGRSFVVTTYKHLPPGSLEIFELIPCSVTSQTPLPTSHGVIQNVVQRAKNVLGGTSHGDDSRLTPVFKDTNVPQVWKLEKGPTGLLTRH